MDRKDYWNKAYTNYWKSATAEANLKGNVSHLPKSSSGDFKTPGEAVMVSFFESLQYGENDRLLDYGCGFGRFYPFFSRMTDYYGIDISQAMIDECTNRYPESSEKFLVAEGEKLPFQDGFFDKIICYGVFDACYQERALSEMLRVCKAGGVILFTGKNSHYYETDGQALIAEEAARRKGHPNYFTNVNEMLHQLKRYADVKQERYYAFRGDFANAKFQTSIPDKFYEWALVIEKKTDSRPQFDKFSDMYSDTWKSEGKTEVINGGSLIE